MKSDWKQTRVKDAIGVPLCVNEVKGHVPGSREVKLGGKSKIV